MKLLYSINAMATPAIICAEIRHKSSNAAHPQQRKTPLLTRLSQNNESCGKCKVVTDMQSPRSSTGVSGILGFLPSPIPKRQEQVGIRKLPIADATYSRLSNINKSINVNWITVIKYALNHIRSIPNQKTTSRKCVCLQLYGIQNMVSPILPSLS
jgi:hypothetical protein